ncbi:TonB-dependent receptor [Polaribacter reichenbachii]|uniref:TonB-dependent receptor n=1 Tax=Polaribacter reichenbachii TaxID=996801 RepID=A0A1B8U6G7_9FLAO|nr:TonB-dependent receptor [Polaribacter reichenbachii]APZ46109.1 TonB-dependent receptor [Polaribacter reichenbachii]AUC19971.1 TonB-dependent receptor [Polaribacter reichenbachii]OBY67483.1 TonB-dependent receptor [Polaribacter reichenbachii]
MKKIIFFLFLFASVIANAQSFTVKGTVYNENKEPLAGASVFVKENKLGTSTDFDGNFSLKLAKGTYTLEVSFLGYKTISDKIIINQNEEYDIILKQDETVLEEVLVSAVRANTDVPVTFSNLSKKEIAKRNLGQDIPVLLNYMPSVVSSSDAGAGVGYTYMSVRGSNGERINVTVNGIPYNDAESHGTFWVNLGDFASSTQNLQLQRGVGTSTNGSGAFGASLNILTDAVSDEAFGEISNSFGSYNTRKHTVKFSTGKINDHIEIAGRLSNISSDGYVDRAFADLKSYYLQGSYTDENTLIKAITFGGKEKTYQAWYGLTADELAADRRQNPYTYDNEVDDYNQNHYQLHWNEKLNDNWSTNLGLNYTKGSGFFEQFEDDTDEINLYDGIVVATDSYINDWGQVVPITDLIRRRWLENDFYVVNFNTNYKTDHLNLISGISYSNYTGDHFGEVIWAKELSENANIRDRYYFSDAKKTDFSIFTKATFDITENLAGYADLQGRFVNYQTAGLTSDRDAIDVDASFSFFNPKFGLTYKINNSNNLYTSFAVANREPNRNDFEGGVTTPETLNDFEFGWRLNKPTIKLNTNIYFMDYKNQLVLTGALDDVGAPIRATSGSSYRLGLEIDADIRISNKFSVKPNAAFSSNKNRDFFVTRDGNTNPTALGNTDISFSPDVVVGNMFNYNPIENLQISFLSKFVGKQFMSNFSSAISENDVLDSFFTSDLNIVYQIKPNKIFKSITLTALVNNIFDTEYVDRGYYGIYDDDWSVAGVTTTVDYAGYYPQATRNFLIGATLRF